MFVVMLPCWRTPLRKSAIVTDADGARLAVL
jgi:hypothetical protein